MGGNALTGSGALTGGGSTAAMPSMASFGGGGTAAGATSYAVPALQAGGAAAGGAAAAGGSAAGGAAAGSMPSWVGPAVNAGIGLIGQNQAINASERGSQAQIDLLREMNAQNRADNQPLLDMRNSVLPRINALMSDPNSITQDPGYQFGLNEGNRQISNRQAASGSYYSGAALREAQRFGQDYAGSRLNDSLNRLMGVAGLGQVGATGNANNNAQFGQQAGNSMVNTGNIRGSGYMGGFNTLNNGVNSWMQDSYWDKMLKGGGD
jgi:hypothetical protein